MMKITIAIFAAFLALLAAVAGVLAQTSTVQQYPGAGYVVHSPSGTSIFSTYGNTDGSGVLHGPSGTTTVQRMGDSFVIHGPATAAELAPALSAPAKPLGGTDAGANTR